MKNVPLGKSGESVSEICLGAMFLGSSTGASTSFRILDTYVEAGGSFIDTANIYASWVPGFSGGESETLLGEWMRQRKNRSQLFLASKVGFGYGEVKQGLSSAQIQSECEKTLKRLGVETIDLYYAHVDDRTTPQEESLVAFQHLIRAGKVRFVGASNFLAWRLAEAEAIAASQGWSGYCCIQQRHTFLRPQLGASFGPQIAANDDLLDYCRVQGISLLSYSPLLGGAYTRDDRGIPEQYVSRDSEVRLERLETLSKEMGITANQLVLAWLMQAPPGSIPLAAGSTVEQIRENLGAAEVKLTQSHIDWLSA